MLLNFRDPIETLIIMAAFVVAISVHEASHAATANWLGDPTARLMGRMTLNPLRHLDVLGTIFLVVVGFGWGKAGPGGRDAACVTADKGRHWSRRPARWPIWRPRSSS